MVGLSLLRVRFVFTLSFMEQLSLFLLRRQSRLCVSVIANCAVLLITEFYFVFKSVTTLNLSEIWIIMKKHLCNSFLDVKQG